MNTSHMTGRAIPKNATHFRAWVIYQLTIRGSSLSAIARTLGVKRQSVHVVFRRRYRRAEEAIAAALNVPVEHLWPERYANTGKQYRKTLSK